MRCFCEVAVLIMSRQTPQAADPISVQYGSRRIPEISLRSICHQLIASPITCPYTAPGTVTSNTQPRYAHHLLEHVHYAVKIRIILTNTQHCFS